MGKLDHSTAYVSKIHLSVLSATAVADQSGVNVPAISQLPEERAGLIETM
jgi:hypothetical protein